MSGITPEFKLTDGFKLHFDFTAIHNRAQHYNRDGSVARLDNNLDGLMYTTSIGLYYSLNQKKLDASSGSRR